MADQPYRPSADDLAEARATFARHELLNYSETNDLITELDAVTAERDALRAVCDQARVHPLLLERMERVQSDVPLARLVLTAGILRVEYVVPQVIARQLEVGYLVDTTIHLSGVTWPRPQFQP